MKRENIYLWLFTTEGNFKNGLALSWNSIQCEFIKFNLDCSLR